MSEKYQKVWDYAECVVERKELMKKQAKRENKVWKKCLDFVRILRISPLCGCIQQNFEGLNMSENIGRKKVLGNRCNAKKGVFYRIFL